MKGFTMQLRVVVKVKNKPEYSIRADGLEVGHIRKTHDLTGHPCYGVFFQFKKRPMFFGSLATARAVAENYQESDFSFDSPQT